MREKMARFMAGRYGSDAFSRFLSVAAVILVILSLFTTPYLYIAALVVIVYLYYRMFSRNISRRYAENEKFLALTARIRRKAVLFKTHAQQRKVYRFYRCPQCRQKVRVPKGRGRICITCPKCRNEFVKVS